MERIRKELNDSIGNYESTAARNIHSDYSDEKETTEFVDEIQAMTDNDPSKSIRIMGMPEFLIRQLVHKEIR